MGRLLISSQARLGGTTASRRAEVGRIGANGHFLRCLLCLVRCATDARQVRDRCRSWFSVA